MLPDYSRPENRGRKLLICIDFGTAFSAVAHTIHPLPTPESSRSLAIGKIPIRNLRFVRFRGLPQVSSEFAWNAQDNEWVWGAEVEDRIDRQEIPEGARIQLIKLCLEQSDLTEETRMKVKRQLDILPAIARQQLGPDDIPWAERLVALYLKKLWEEAKPVITNTYHCSDGNIFEGRDIEIWIAVPKFVTYSTRGAVLTL